VWSFLGGCLVEAINTHLHTPVPVSIPIAAHPYVSTSQAPAKAPVTDDELNQQVQALATSVLAGTVPVEEAKAQLWFAGYWVSERFMEALNSRESMSGEITPIAQAKADEVLRWCSRNANWALLASGALKWCGFVWRSLAPIPSRLGEARRRAAIVARDGDVSALGDLRSPRHSDPLDRHTAALAAVAPELLAGTTDIERLAKGLELLTAEDAVNLVDNHSHLLGLDLLYATSRAQDVVDCALLYCGIAPGSLAWSGDKVARVAQTLISPRPRIRSAQVKHMVAALKEAGYQSHQATGLVRSWVESHTDMSASERCTSGPVMMTERETSSNEMNWRLVPPRDRAAVSAAAVSAGARIVDAESLPAKSSLWGETVLQIATPRPPGRAFTPAPPTNLRLVARAPARAALRLLAGRFAQRSAKLAQAMSDAAEFVCRNPVTARRLAQVVADAKALLRANPDAPLLAQAPAQLVSV